MGACISFSKKKTSAVEDDNSCIICYNRYAHTIRLDCNHNVHAECITRWWATMPDGGLRCPICRRNTYQCYLEIDKDRKPVGYYRQDNRHSMPIVIRVLDKDDTTRTTIERLPLDTSSRNKVLNAMLFYNVCHANNQNQTNSRD